MKIPEMKIGILCSKIRLEEKMLFQEFSKRNYELIQINPNELSINGGKDEFGNIDLLLNREIAQIRAELILELAEKAGIRTLNSAPSTRLCNNKAMTTSILKEAGIPVPNTVITFSADEALKAAEYLKYPLVIKPIWGSWGRLLSKADTPEALETILEHKQALNSPYHSIFYLQEYIEKPDRDIRIFVIGGKAVAGMYRVSEHWLTNTAKGAVPQILDLNKEINDIVHKTVKTLGVEIAGVDLVESGNGYLVLEVNATPEFHGLMEVANVNIAGLFYDYITSEIQ